MRHRTRLACVAALALLTIAPVARAATVAEWGAAFTRPALAGAGIPAAGRKLVYGHLKLSFSAGKLFPVKALDRVVGVFFVGAGTFRYTSTDKLESPIDRYVLGTDLPERKKD